MSLSNVIYNQLANHKLFNKRIKFGLKRIKLALSKLNYPEKQLLRAIRELLEEEQITLNTENAYQIRT